MTAHNKKNTHKATCYVYELTCTKSHQCAALNKNTSPNNGRIRAGNAIKEVAISADMKNIAIGSVI